RMPDRRLCKRVCPLYRQFLRRIVNRRLCKGRPCKGDCPLYAQFLHVVGNEEGVTAVTGVFGEAVADRDGRHAMAEQPAEIADLLLELRAFPVGIVAVAKDQRMAALDADVFTRAVTIGERLILVMAEEAGERVPDAGDAARAAQVRRSAAAGSIRAAL